MSLLPELCLAGGGTGGHLYPGLSLAEECKALKSDLSVFFIGTRHGLEGELIPRAGYPLHLISAGRGSPFSFENPMNSVRFCQAIVESWILLRRKRPFALVALGGFAAAAPGIAAGLLRIPVILLEQNVIPGRVTRLLSRWAREVHLQFPEAGPYLPSAQGRLHSSGSPLRPALKALALLANRPAGRLLIMGGSQGAQGLNRLVCEAAPQLVEAGIPFTHITGHPEWKDISAVYSALGDGARALPYLDSIEEGYRDAKLALMRAGASSAAELTALGIPAILVPYPAASDDHQTANARVLQNAGAAVMAYESYLNAPKLAEMIIRLWRDPERLKKMSSAMSSLGRVDAGEVIASSILRLLPGER